MCGRWATPFTKEHIEHHYKITVSSFTPSYNITPGSKTLVIVNERHLLSQIMRWGLIPSWAKDERIGYKLINARAETLLEKPSFKKPFFTSRCLIPAGGFYEWKKTEDGKIPYYIHLKDTPLFSFAGLYDVWKDTTGKTIQSYTIITTAPNAVMKPIHDRMPVILTEHDEGTWLNTNNITYLSHLLKPYPHESNMELYPVSTRVNNPSCNNPNIIKRVEN